jgi:NDP-sugar pyrophosphorylase family protein
MNDFKIENFFEIELYEHKKLFTNIKNIWEALNNIKEYFKDKKCKCIRVKIPSNCYLQNSETIFIEENTIIEPNTFIKGPCYIGKNCQIRHGAYIRGNVIAGDNCVIGHCTEVKNSILLDNVQAAHFAYIGDSIVGNNVNLGAGVKCANFRLDKKIVNFFFKNIKIQTNLRKFGAIIGDNSQIGCNTVLNPATFFEKDVICYSNLNVRGYHLSNTIIKQTKKNVSK